MERPTSSASTLRYHRWLPYWAVFQTDLRQTMRSWVYRLWVVVSLVAAIGFLLYRFGIHREAGLVQSASVLTSEVLRVLILGSLALIVVITVSGISAERGTLADSILSRGISRYQYFLAKWHARSAVILFTFVLMAMGVLLASYFMLDEDLTLIGSFVALLTVSMGILAIVSWGVTVGALSNSTVLGITVMWLVIYGIGFVLSLLPPAYPSLERILTRMPNILRGVYDWSVLSEMILVSLFISALAALVGLVGFARKDV